MPHVDEGQLHAYLDGELTPVERARVDEHLAGCAACRTRLDEERQLIERAGKLLGFAAPVDRPAPPLAGLARPRRWWHVRMPLAWAATVILAIGLGWSLSEQLGRPEMKTLEGPVAVRETQAPAAQPSATTTGPSYMHRQRSENPAPPALAQKSEPRRDSAATDEIKSLSAAEERDAGGATGSVAAPKPAAAPPAAMTPSNRADVRLQAVTVAAAQVALDSAAVRAILGREPSVIPGLPVRRITRSQRAPDEIVVEQMLDSTRVITLWERPVVPASRDAAALATRGATDAKAAPDYVGIGRNITGVWVQIQGGVAADSLKKLLGKIKA